MRFGLSVFPGGRGEAGGADRSLTRAPQPEDEGGRGASAGGAGAARVLVLGLDGSGEKHIPYACWRPPLEGHIPTWGFNSVRLPTRDFEVDLLESEQTPPPLAPVSPIISAGPKLGLVI